LWHKPSADAASTLSGSGTTLAVGANSEDSTAFGIRGNTSVRELHTAP